MQFFLSFPAFYFIRNMFCLLQVEFNKAAQSLTDAMIPSTQKKTALSRLVKVG